MVVNWREKKECGHDAKEGADMDSVHSAVPLKSVGLNLLNIVVGNVAFICSAPTQQLVGRFQKDNARGANPYFAFTNITNIKYI